MADPQATTIQRGVATWVAALESLPGRRPILQAYVEALAQAQRVPELQTQLAAHYRHARQRVSDLVALSLADGTDAEDPRCRSIATFAIAVCDGLAMQWLLDPDLMPTGDKLRDGLTVVWAASGIAYQPPPDLPPEISRTAGRTSAK